MRRWIVSIGIWVGACIEVAPLLSCPEYDGAMALLDEVSSTTLDPTLGDPRFGPVVTALEKVGPGCKEHMEASMTASTIRAAMAKRGATPTPNVPKHSPAAAASAPGSGANTTDEAERQAVMAYLGQVAIIDGGSAKQAQVAGLVQTAFAKGGDFTGVITEVTKIEGQLERLKVPGSCAAFHQANLQIAKTTRSSLEALHRAIADKDDEAIKTIQEQAPAHREEIARVEAMRAQLHTRFGP